MYAVAGFVKYIQIYEMSVLSTVKCMQIFNKYVACAGEYMFVILMYLTLLCSYVNNGA